VNLSREIFMNIALVAQQRFFETIRKQFQLMPAFGKHTANRTLRTAVSIQNAPDFIAASAIPARPTSHFINKSTDKPLRILRVVESGQSSASVGRMVISGRMADVCAELDRLAAREAALT
jgi:hypothetical protein